MADKGVVSLELLATPPATRLQNREGQVANALSEGCQQNKTVHPSRRLLADISTACRKYESFNGGLLAVMNYRFSSSGEI